jgi:hypothetical protein
MVGNDYNIALSLFFITYTIFHVRTEYSYIIFEVPANLVLRIVRPSLFFPAIMLGWGIVKSYMACVDHRS